MREFTFSAVFLGVLLSIVMGAANVYLGLKVGMTVSASIPASVIAMGIYQSILRRKSILESNLVQTAASAGESLAAGIIFTMPAMVMIGVWNTFDFWTTTMVALGGGLLGTLFMIPMRKVFIVDNRELKYPEGVACAEVLRAGEGAEGAKSIFHAIGVGGGFKIVGSFFGLFTGTMEFATMVGKSVFVFAADLSPALIGVGFIVGLEVALQVFAGGAIGWLIGIPLLGATNTEGSPLDLAWVIWKTQIRYIGVGAMVVGGILSIWKVRGGLKAAAIELFSGYRNTMEPKDSKRDRSLSGRELIVLSAVCIGLIAATYYVLLGKHAGITVATTLMMVVMAFFFTAVASYIVGLVGSSNSPVSGMTITVVLATGLLLYILGYKGVEGMIATLGVAGVVCCVCCTAGDTCNDLKTGLMVGASPRLQQIAQILGVTVAAFVMSPVLVAIHEGSINNGTGGIGGKELPAPQAGMFASLTKGLFGHGELPWNMIVLGAFVAMGILILDKVLSRRGFRIPLHVMPVAVGIYLPLGLSVTMLIGGFLNHYLVRGSKAEESANKGTLIASGLIAGESLIGVALAILAYFEFTSLKWSENIGVIGTEILSIAAFAAIVAWFRRKAK